jgi:hypothetical protein
MRLNLFAAVAALAMSGFACDMPRLAYEGNSSSGRCRGRWPTTIMRKSTRPAGVLKRARQWR